MMKIALDNTDCFNSQPPEGGWRTVRAAAEVFADVSTHSRPKAAGIDSFDNNGFVIGFNSQPPEGGWNPYKDSQAVQTAFQLTAARRRLVRLGVLRGAVV